MNSSPNSSTSNLIQRLRTKDYSSVFATLQNQYGMNGQCPSRPTSRTKSTKVEKSSSSSSSSTSGTIPPTERDWESAFGTLQSTYGFSGQAPCIPNLPSKPKSKSKQMPSSKKSRSGSEKTLEEQYGLGWGPVVPVHRNGL